MSVVVLKVTAKAVVSRGGITRNLTRERNVIGNTDFDAANSRLLFERLLSRAPQVTFKNGDMM